MKRKVHVILVDGVNQEDFINDFNLNSQVEVLDTLDEISGIIAMNIEESYIQIFEDDTRVFYIEEDKFEPVPASTLPEYYQQGFKTVTATLPATSENGSNYIPLQFYLNTDQIISSQTLGSTNADTLKSLSNVNYFSRWTGKNVDVVALEVGPVNASYAGLHNSHPDCLSVDNPGSSKVIPMNWSGLTSPDNNQITSNSLFDDHSRGVFSACSGTVCGFAKKSSYRTCYLNDPVINCINSIVSWHNSKPINPETGIKNPTILISEYQFLQDRMIGVKVDDIQSITDLNGTVSRPGASWGSDLTPFVSRNIIPWKIYDPVDSVYSWGVIFPTQGRFTALQIALEQAWNAGIVIVNAAGNNGGVYVKTSDPTLMGVYCTAQSGATTYNMDPSTFTVSLSKSTLASTTIYRPFYSLGPHGLNAGIDVAAGQNSEVYPLLDPYSNRGPGIDIVGLGVDTWTSSPDFTYADGNTWGMFSGTSCAAPTVAGICACLMERYYVYNNRWPTPNEVKNILLNEAKSVVKGVSSTTWNNVPPPSTNYVVNGFSPNNGSTIFNYLFNGMARNGQLRISELLGTTTKRVFLNSQSFNRSQTQSKRPTSGRSYPRPKIRRSK